MKFETKIKKEDIEAVQKLYKKAQQEAADFEQLLKKPIAEGGIKEALVGFFLLAGMLTAGNAQASAKDFHNFIGGIEKISSSLDIHSKSTLSGNTGAFKLEIGPYLIDGTYSGGDNATIDSKVTLKKDAAAHDLEVYKPLAKKIADGLGMQSLQILSK